MDVVHFYTSRWSFRENIFRLLCTKEWFKETSFLPTLSYHEKPAHVTTVERKVTCQECLKIIIPRLESDLKLVRANLHED